MADHRLYTRTIPSDALMDSQGQASQELAKLGILDGQGVTESVAGNPNQIRLEGQYRGKLAETAATSLRELLSADAMSPMPFYAVGGAADDGYYSPETADRSRVDPRSDGAVSFTGTLALEGTNASHRLGVETTVMDVSSSTNGPYNPWGSTSEARIGLPAAATEPLWVDLAGGAVSRASVTVESTVSAEFGDVDLVDPEAPSFDDPTLIYALPYVDQGDVDSICFDTYGRSEFVTASDGADVFAWGDVFRPDHEFRGEAILENGLLQLTFDVANNSLSAECWDDANTTWSSVSLGSSGNAPNWQLFAIDLVAVDMTRVEMQTTWEDTTDGSLYSLDVALDRGWSDGLWTRPASETASVPSGLVTKLDPVASSRTLDAQPSSALVAREEVRK